MKKMKIFIYVLISLLIMVSGVNLFANGSGESNGTGALIGIAMPETHVERWRRDGEELKKIAMAMGYKAEVVFADADQSKQNKQIQDLITKGAKLIIVGSVNEGVAEAVSEAKAEGVIIIAYDRLITNSDAYEYYITFDNFKVGQFQGQAIADALDLKNASTSKKITYFAGSPTDNNAFVFFDGAMDVLNPFVESGKLTVIGPAPKQSSDSAFTKIATENWRPEEAKKRMENLLIGDASKVTLDAVLAPNDTLGRAIIEALLTDNKYTTTLPIITGQDGELSSIKMIRDGKQHMTVFKDTRNLAKGAIALADALLKNQVPKIDGARVDKDSYNTGKKKVTSYLLEPIKVTMDNYQKVMIDSGYYSQDQLDN